MGRWRGQSSLCCFHGISPASMAIIYGSQSFTPLELPHNLLNDTENYLSSSGSQEKSRGKVLNQRAPSIQPKFGAFVLESALASHPECATPAQAPGSLWPYLSDLMWPHRTWLVHSELLAGVMEQKPLKKSPNECGKLLLCSPRAREKTRAGDSTREPCWSHWQGHAQREVWAGNRALLCL